MNPSAERTACQSPLCPDSGQSPQRNEMTLCANKRHRILGLRGGLTLRRWVWARIASAASGARNPPASTKHPCLGGFWRSPPCGDIPQPVADTLHRCSCGIKARNKPNIITLALAVGREAMCSLWQTSSGRLVGQPQSAVHDCTQGTGKSGCRSQ